MAGAGRKGCQGGLSHQTVPAVASRCLIHRGCRCDTSSSCSLPEVSLACVGMGWTNSLQIQGLLAMVGVTLGGRQNSPFFSLRVKRLQGPWQQPQREQPARAAVHLWLHTGVCGQLGRILRDAAAGPRGRHLLHCECRSPHLSPCYRWLLVIGNQAIPQPRCHPGQQQSLPRRNSSRRSSVLKMSTSGRRASASSRSRPATRSRYQPLCSHGVAEPELQLLGGMWAEGKVAVVPVCLRVLADPCSGRLGSLAGGRRRRMCI